MKSYLIVEKYTCPKSPETKSDPGSLANQCLKVIRTGLIAQDLMYHLEVMLIELSNFLLHVPRRMFPVGHSTLNWPCLIFWSHEKLNKSCIFARWCKSYQLSSRGHSHKAVHAPLFKSHKGWVDCLVPELTLKSNTKGTTALFLNQCV